MSIYEWLIKEGYPSLMGCDTEVSKVISYEHDALFFFIYGMCLDACRWGYLHQNPRANTTNVSCFNHFSCWFLDHIPP